MSICDGACAHLSVVVVVVVASSSKEGLLRTSRFFKLINKQMSWPQNFFGLWTDFGVTIDA